jgi:glycosyltransferase involved in cell wall biosynthesis
MNMTDSGSAIAVGCIFDRTGMQTWCIEAAEALAASGERVFLFHSAAVPAPVVSTGIELIAVAHGDVLPAVARGKFKREFSRISTHPGRFVRSACRELQARQINPWAFLLNASMFVDPAVEVPQFVVAWAFPASLSGYLRKLPIHHDRLLSIDGIRTALDQIGWYRRDWFAYRHAAGVLSVSRRLDSAIRRAGLNSTMVHPGIRVEQRQRSARGERTRLVMMAADLDSPRKRVPWMLNALGDFPIPAEITLIGVGSQKIVDLARSTRMPVDATGPLARHEALAAIREGDVFLFGSLLDDWGYVLLEAMAAGLAVVAPRMSPFDEILGPAGLLFTPSSAKEFRQAAIDACGRTPDDAAAQSKWLEAHFSSQVFSRRLLEAMGLERGR